MGTRLEHALALAEKGFWIFPLKAKGKTPAHKGWQDEATRNPDTIKAWFSSHAYNVGIFTSRFGDDKALIVVDVDNKGDKKGDEHILRLELEGRDFPTTFTQSTPTGGRHLVYVSDVAVKQGANTLAPGLDTRSRGGYIVGVGSVLGIGAYGANNDPVAHAPQWLVDFCGVPADRPAQADVDLSRVDRERATRRAIEFLSTAPVSVEGEGGDETAYKVACRVKDFGVDAGMCLSLMMDHWNDRCTPPWNVDQIDPKVRNAYSYGTEAPGASAPEAQFPPVQETAASTDDEQAPVVGHPFQELNKKYAFTTAGGGGHILFETTDDKGRFKLEHLAVSAFHNWFANKPFQVGKKTVPVSQAWMEYGGRRQYESVVFAPGMRVDPRFYNMWRGFTVEPNADVGTRQRKAVEAFHHHALQNVCGGDKDLCKWLIGYFAHMIQRPSSKPLTALVFKGKKGTGKNALVERVGELLGAHFMVADDDRYLTGNFNGHMESMLFLVLDEAAWAGDKRAEGKLKGLITGKSHNIEHKGEKVYTVANLTRVAIVGNEDWLVPASGDERRFAVFDVGDGQMQDRAFFEEMRVGMELGGYALLLHQLLHFDLSTIDVNAAPVTKGLHDQKLATLGPFEQWWLECLTEGRLTQSDFGSEWPGRIDCTAFREAVGRYYKSRHTGRIPDDREMGRRLLAVLPVVKHSRGPKPEQRYRYELPPLETARQAWDKFIGHPGVWG